MASYMSELAYLANPVSSHVQSAEMHNQAVNSLALISARYTLESAEVVSLMSASYLYTICQALDLRVLQKVFFEHLEPALYAINLEVLGEYLSPTIVEELHIKLWTHVQVTWLLASNKDTQDRAAYIVDMALAILTQSLLDNPQGSLSSAAGMMQDWKTKAHSLLVETYTTTRAEFFINQTTPDYLGNASKRIYLFVRTTLGVPFNKGLEDHPTPKSPIAANGSRKQTIGSWISIIYSSLRSGTMHGPLMECLAEAGLVAGAAPVENPVANGTQMNSHDVDDGDDFINGSNDIVPSHRQPINEAVRRLSINDSSRKESIEEAVRNHSIDINTVAEEGDQPASLSLAHGALTGL
ncbi:MAG: hypothetical protein Q9192_006158 [Flavoplaca navasiana]